VIYLKTINETFTDDEYLEMIKYKKIHGLNWHDFIIQTIKDVYDIKE